MPTITVENATPCRVFEITPGESLLIGSEKCLSRAIPVGCRGGGCGVCKVRIVAGSYHSKCMSKAHICESQAEAGYALACRVYPLSDMRIEVVNQSQAEKACLK
ncbi:2Fe-2S iron-sulfur cluster binding domain-containing protein [Amphritea atlantica]|uniref:2Fe-2S iron-sulfur cluster binding domain-containing protein n=1 Tax=Amphritea atlantica TaxID=355243 RepID=A0ABY5GR68_9GAMM|nr:2Fe-2S iron-sulfur cluster binding domain-containing protein [Amphritea atlantica]